MICIGVDPSLANTGLVVLSGEGKVITTANTLDALKGWAKQTTPVRNSTFSQVDRLSLVWGFTEEVLFKAIGHPFKGTLHIGYENYSFESTNRAFSLGELGGVLKTGLQGLPWETNLTVVPPTLLKQFAVGHGDAGKEEIMARAFAESRYIRELGKKERTNDVCDAYFLAKFAWYKGSAELVVAHETHKEMLRNRLEIVKD